MQDPSTKKEEAVKAADNNTNDEQEKQPITQLADDTEENPDYQFYDLEGGEG